MKTVEQAAKEYAPKSPLLQTCFREGVEFAQRWISVYDGMPEDELPEVDKTKPILLKGFDDMGEECIEFGLMYKQLKDVRIGVQQCFCTDKIEEVTHWRYIEYK